MINVTIMENQLKNFDEVIKKVEALKKSGTVDLSTEEDLSIAVMNLVSLEEHFFFTGSKTGDSKYFDLLNEAREARKNLLARLIDKHEGETWCISKHLLATTMRLIEVGTKLYSDGKKDEAQETYRYAEKMYALFWALRLKLIDTAGFKAVAAGDKPSYAKAAADKPWTLQDIVNKLVNCCDE